MKFKIVVLILFSINVSMGQVHVSEFIRDSNIAKNDYNKLYFIDFWATWCAPCIHVSKYLETLQNQYSEDFYIVSLSQENPDLVKQFIKRHKVNLAVAIDFEGETFQKNKINSLPYGILYNASGKKLWEGHPAELKDYHVAKFLKQNTKKASVSNMFIVNNVNYTQTNNVYKPINDFEYLELESVAVDGLQIKYKQDYIELSGSLKDILAYSNKVNKNQIKIGFDLNKKYKMYFKYHSNAFKNMEKTILKSLNLTKEEAMGNGYVLVFSFNNAMLWDKHQINWGINNEKYLIGDTQIKADNVSLEDMMYKLSSILETPIVYNKSGLSQELHDWQIHYKYYDLMVSNLYDTYGIKVEKQISSYPEYIIKKAL
ncbi:hypothetical protein BWZ22_02325 [Seonamhaeicola sp. S2-3]|uniref:TlpA family protein disulfide reductase n=1 Tax=Seonamhaeicola sp. S2-3 TaxID=1936081 RepID=UPI0009726E7B|nr:TlpA disulfide reductase family protein [Seonamhaeicola sp. S2-3]APY10138.1 hypothetical protein BWZ22_02325 [Seonamhaeicola sp. S2-3]